jgi:hypothetical protein
LDRAGEREHGAEESAEGKEYGLPWTGAARSGVESLHRMNLLLSAGTPA